MIGVGRQSLFLVVLSLALVSAAEAALSAPGWLMRMDRAAKRVSYTGTFVYQHGNLLETMRIFHRAGVGGVRELLESLNGVQREIIRGHRQIKCYFPNEDALVVERARMAHAGFPSALPQHLKQLSRYYVFHLGGKGRVAGRVAQIVLIQPRDGYRYGYRLWADETTGLLLRSDLVDEHGQIIEQFMFTQIHPGAHIPASDLEPPYERTRHWQRETAEVPTSSRAGWIARRLPQGFHRIAYLVRQTPGRPRVRHLVYSDGLAAVSVFIQRLPAGDHSAMVGLKRMGAVHVYGKVVTGHQVTVMGEVPKATVALIGRSVVQEAP
ncbi:MAG: MucB/RseB C-terminal domain-containing protein [Acidiferrobacteraceae bacterium]